MSAPNVLAALTQADRCDRCGAGAYVRVLLPGGFDLLFCVHHGRAHQEALRAKAVEIQDDTHALDGPLPASSAPSGRPKGPVPGPFRPAHDTER